MKFMIIREEDMRVQNRVQEQIFLKKSFIKKLSIQTPILYKNIIFITNNN